jgi:hypothetical protein
MELLAQLDPKPITSATIGPPIQPPPAPTNYGDKDWGLSIGICALVGMKVWELLKKYHTDDSDLNRELVRALLDERKILLQAVLERKP